MTTLRHPAGAVVVVVLTDGDVDLRVRSGRDDVGTDGVVQFFARVLAVEPRYMDRRFNFFLELELPFETVYCYDA